LRWLIFCWARGCGTFQQWRRGRYCWRSRRSIQSGHGCCMGSGRDLGPLLGERWFYWRPLPGLAFR